MPNMLQLYNKKHVTKLIFPLRPINLYTPASGDLDVNVENTDH